MNEKLNTKPEEQYEKEQIIETRYEGTARKSSGTGGAQYTVFGMYYKPQGFYHDTFQQVLKGLLYGIELRGNIEKVYRWDILTGSGIDPLVYDTYFKSPGIIMRDIYEELELIIGEIEKNMKRYRQIEVLHFLLLNLSEQPLMIKILLAINEKKFWYEHLRNILLYVTAPDRWGEQDELWDIVYWGFCEQLVVTLKWWKTFDFDEEHLDEALFKLKKWMLSFEVNRSGQTQKWLEWEN